MVIPPPRRRSAALILLIFAVATSRAFAISYTWTGNSATQDWFQPNNWVDSGSNPGVPGPADTASIPPTVQINLTQDVTITALTADMTTIIGSGSLKVTGSCVLHGVTLVGPGSATLQGETTIDNAQSNATTAIQGRHVINSGTATLKSGATLAFGSSAGTLTNDGTFKLEDNTHILVANGGNGSKIDNSGIFNKVGSTGTAEVGVGLLLKNSSSGVIGCFDGTLILRTVDHSGDLIVSKDKSIIIDTELQVHDGARFSGPGITSLIHGVAYLDGMATVSGHFNLGAANTTSLTFTLNAKDDPSKLGTVVIAGGGVVDWLIGTITSKAPHEVAATIAVDNGGKLMLSGLAGKGLDNASIESDTSGVIDWQGGTFQMLNGAQIVNDGTFTTESDDRLASDGTASFVNFGEVTKTASPNDPNSLTPGVTQIEAKFDNDAEAVVSSLVGTLGLQGGNEIQLRGEIRAEGKGIVTLSGGPLLISSDVDLTGTGHVVVYGAVGTPTLRFDSTGRIHVQSGTLDLEGSTVSGPGTINVLSDATLAWSGTNLDVGGEAEARGTVSIKEGAKMVVSSAARSITGWSIFNHGTITFLPLTENISFGAGSAIKNAGALEFQSDNALLDISGGIHPPKFSNLSHAMLTKTAGNGTTKLGFGLSNSGTVTIQSGTLSVAGTYTDTSDTTPPGVIHLDSPDAQHLAAVKFEQSLTTKGTLGGYGVVDVVNGWTNEGTANCDVIQVEGDLGNDGTIAGKQIDIPFKAEKVEGAVVSTAMHAPIAPGGLVVQGNFTQTPKGTLYVFIQGTNASTPDYTEVKISGTASLAGAVFFNLENGFVPPADSSFPFLTAASVSGSFAGVKGGVVATGNTGVTASNVTGLPNNSLLNISTRLPVQTGTDVSIGGFIVQGIVPKNVMMRGIGPSLASVGVAGALPDPLLALHDGTGATVTTNDNWKDTQKAEIEASGIAPTDDHESAIVAKLYPGAYSAVLSGTGGTTGIGLVEAYDLDQAAFAEPVNISTRGRVDSGNAVMIGGFIIGGTDSMRVLLRAIGPSLAAAGVSDALQDPLLELHNGNGDLIVADNDWKDAQQTEIEATGIPPADDRESAIIATLPPASYTAVLRGNNGDDIGVGLVEVYNLR